MRSLVLALLALCASTAETQPTRSLPVVRPVRLTAAVPDTLLVTDLLGAAAWTAAFASTAEVAARQDTEEWLVLTAREGFEGLALVPFTVGGADFVLPVEVRVPTTHTFAFTPDLATQPVSTAALDSLYVIGAFNDWARGRDRLADPEGDGTYAVTLPVAPGRYAYKFQVGAAEAMDPANPVQVPNGLGGLNNVVVVPPRREDRAVLRPLGWERAGAHEALYRFALDWREADGNSLRPDLGAGDVAVLLNDAPVPPEDVAIEDALITVRVPTGEGGGLATLRLAADLDGLVTPWVETPLADGRPLGEAEAAGDAPFVWQDAVLYQVLIDRFRDGDPSNSAPVVHDSLAVQANYQGGDLQGVLDAIEEGYFDRLGVNALWLSPVNDNPDAAYRESPPPHRYYTGYHGYWPVAPRAVEEHFGDLALLRRVVDAAHAHGIRVLLDFVAHHVHEDHPYFREHPDWFGALALPDGTLNLRRWDEHRLTTWFEPYLPTFDYQHAPAAVDAVTADAAWWLRETGADGFRHDAVKHVPNAFWRALTARLDREVAPERAARGAAPLYQIGETFGSYALVASYVNAGQLDAQFNFNLYDAAVQAFTGAGSFESLAGEVARTLDVYGPLPLMGNLMDSHDKPRFLALADGDLPPGADAQAVAWTDPPRVDDPASYRRAELYLAYLLTLPGVPTLYYGDEIGMTGAADPDNRRMMRFDGLSAEEEAMKAATARLVHLRRAHPALRVGTFETLRADADTWAYLRTTPDDAVLVVLGKSAEARPLALDLPDAYGFTAAADAFDGAAVALDGPSLTLSVPAGGYRVVSLTR